MSSSRFAGSARKESQRTRGSTRKSSGSQSSHILAKAGAILCASRMSATTQHTALNRSMLWVYRAPNSQLSSHSTNRVTSPAFRHSSGCSWSRRPRNPRRYSRRLTNDSTTRAASVCATSSATSGMGCPPSTRMRISTAPSRMLADRSSRPFRWTFAAAFRREMQPTNLRTSSWYRGTSSKPSPVWLISIARNLRSRSIASATRCFACSWTWIISET
mmetsp:Transcript_74046/g.233876  ORF Transcript_74046/g.233876 Transcript_74046/m.233876 type:complete len:217 (+) Transcript_74046:918-1568(+)